MEEWIDLALKVGGPFGLSWAAFVYALYKEWIVLGKTCMEMRRERDEWKSAALHGTKLARLSLDGRKPTEVR